MRVTTRVLVFIAGVLVGVTSHRILTPPSELEVAATKYYLTETKKAEAMTTFLLAREKEVREHTAMMKRINGLWEGPLPELTTDINRR